MPGLNVDDFSLGDLVGALASQGLKPPGGGGSAGGGGGSDPIALAEAGGFGLYWMEDAADYVEGTGAGSGRIYTLKDQTASQHGGDWTDRFAPTTATLIPRTDDYMQSAVGTSDRFSPTNGDPFSGQMCKIFIFSFPVGAANSANGYIFTHRQSFADRPYFLFTSTAGAWVYQSGGSGGSDVINGIATGINPYDGNWHCLLIHHGANAFEGLIIDLDGQKQFATVAPSHNDLGAFNSFWQLASDNSVNSFNPINTINYRAFAHGQDADLISHATSRALAEALMAKYGITSLA